MLGWDTSHHLFGSEATGHVDLDWSVSVGALFGRQNAIVSDSSESEWFYSAPLFQVNQTGGSLSVPTTTTERSIPGERRSHSTYVPFFGGNLGLSYRIAGTSIGAGYRWERFVDAIDGGIDARQRFDRTIHGLNVKMSVDFGG